MDNCILNGMDKAAQMFKGNFTVLITLLSFNPFPSSLDFCCLLLSSANVADIANNMYTLII